jgi:hypothetical protein
MAEASASQLRCPIPMLRGLRDTTSSGRDMQRDDSVLNKATIVSRNVWEDCR